MRYKFLIPIIAVSFLIGQVSLVTFKKVTEEELKKNYNTKTNADDKFASIINSLKSEELVLSWGDQQSTRINLSDLITGYYRSYHAKESLRLNFEKLNDSIKALAPAINQAPIDAKLEFSEEEVRIKEFSLPQNGKQLNVEKSMAQTAKSLAEGKLSVSLVVDEVQPQITSASLEKLGITTLLGHGESDFKGSSSSRIHNIKTGAAKFYGLLLKPGEEFSFNSALGEVDGKNGYLPELVVKNGKLRPEFGGGICQVSTTLFRAAIAAGLPILERKGHSLPVKYYNPQGFDATIYPGVIDLKFKNDTPNNILIQNKITETKISFEIYGSENGRKIEVDGPNILEQTPSGSMKTILTRKITLPDGSVKEEVFRSSYKSPALFPLEKNPLE